MSPDVPAHGPADPVAGLPLDPALDGPLDRPTALAFLARADELLDAAEYDAAFAHYRRVIGHPDPAVTAAALLGIGTIHWRTDHDDEAIAAWRAVLELPQTDGTYLAYRQLASAFVRAGRLPEAIEAYRDADRLAPAEDRAEIANRLGWLVKEVGDTRGASRYFARGRSGDDRPRATWGIIGITVVVSLLASLPAYGWLFEAFQLDKRAVADGEWWRLLSCTLLHQPLWQSPLHLLFNMYALSFGGAIVERMYGSRWMVALYLLTGAAASTASFALGSDVPSVGASGAVFGMFGILVAASRAHHPVLDRRSQAVLGQIGALVALNLVLGFVIPNVDYLAHIGGLVAGIWLGALVPPGKVRTLRSLWIRPGPTGSGTGAVSGPGEPLVTPSLLATLAVLGVVALVVAGVAYGTALRL